MALYPHTLLLTNDDGFDAPGLQALGRVAKSLGVPQIRVAAPAEPWSVKSHTVTAHGKTPIQLEPFERDGLEGLVVHGCPADCVRVALRSDPPLVPEDTLVLAGINHGANLGVDVYYSGTVAAIREAGFLGCSGIAVSQLISPEHPADWNRAEAWASQVLPVLLQGIRRAPPTLWILNLPETGLPEQLPPVRIVPLSAAPLKVLYREAGDEKRTLYYAGPYRERPAPPGHDVAEAFGGTITLSPLRLDPTCQTTLAENLFLETEFDKLSSP